MCLFFYNKTPRLLHFLCIISVKASKIGSEFVAAFGEYIAILGLDHMLYMIGLIMIGTALFIKRDKVVDNKKVVTLIILMASILQQIILYGSYFHFMAFDLAESLPFHISRVSSILGIIYLITKNSKVFKVVSFFGLFAWTSFLYPSRVHGVLHPIGISFFINHLVTLLLPFYGMIAYREVIQKGDKKSVFPWFLLYLAVAMCVNWLVDGNYFYLKHKPVLSSLSDVIYIPLLILFAYIIFSIGEWAYTRVSKRF